MQLVPGVLSRGSGTLVRALTFVSCFEAMTMQFISHRFPEDHDPTIGKPDGHVGV